MWTKKTMVFKPSTDCVCIFAANLFRNLKFDANTRFGLQSDIEYRNISSENSGNNRRY